MSYSYSRIGEQKCLEQTQQRYGRRISILGLWQPDEPFEYALVQGGFKSTSYISVMDWVAATAAETLKQTGWLTVIVQDNEPIHIQVVRSEEVPDWYFERVVFPGQRLLFEAPSVAQLEVYTGTLATAILSDHVSCQSLSVQLE